MSGPDSRSPDFEGNVRVVTEAVLTHLGLAPGSGGSVPVSGQGEQGAIAGGGGQGPGAGAGCLGWLLGAPSGHGPALSREMEILGRLAWEQRILCVPEAEVALGMMSRSSNHGRATLVGPGGAGEAGLASAWLEAAAGCDLLFIGSLAWHQARALTAFDDRDPAVAVVLDALGAGRAVRLLVGEGLTGLHRHRGRGAQEPGVSLGRRGGAGGAVASEATRLHRALDNLGVSLVSIEAIGAQLAARSAAKEAFGRALGGLLGERDVEQAASEGRRELRLPKDVVVTPLARDRARALGIVLFRED